MFRPTRILVPVDFSRSSMPAVACAHDIARAFGSRVHLLHVSEAPAAQRWPSILSGAEVYRCTADWRADALDQLTTLAVDWSRADGWPDGARRDVLAVRTASDPPTAILAYAREEECDLIVMGTHPGSTLTTLPRGSTTERVRRCASCPVMLVPPTDVECRQAGVPIDDEIEVLAVLAS